MSVDEKTAAAMKITGVVSSVRDAADVLHQDECAVDDQSGGELNPELVKVARLRDRLFPQHGRLRESPNREVLGRHRRRSHLGQMGGH